MLLMSACAAPATTPADTAGDAVADTGAVDGEKTLRIAYGAEIDTLNALTSQNLTDIEILMVEGLIMSNDENTYIPVLAKEIPTQENGGVVMNDDGTVTMTWNLQRGRQLARRRRIHQRRCLLHLGIHRQRSRFSRLQSDRISEHRRL